MAGTKTCIAISRYGVSNKFSRWVVVEDKSAFLGKMASYNGGGKPRDSSKGNYSCYCSTYRMVDNKDFGRCRIYYNITSVCGVCDATMIESTMNTPQAQFVNPDNPPSVRNSLLPWLPFLQAGSRFKVCRQVMFLATITSLSHLFLSLSQQLGNAVW